MKIWNVRLGHANNSSSSHSMIFLPKKKTAHDDYQEFEFGWDHFTLASKDAKAKYLATTLFNNLSHELNEEVAKIVTEAWTGVTLPDSTPYGVHAYVDHQSLMCLPRNRAGDSINKEFLSDLTEYIMNDRLIILGGNDNDDKRHPLLKNDENIMPPIPTDGYSSEFLARKDSRGYWAMFSRRNGTKIRFSFDNALVSPTKADLPELVDLKITDLCPCGCEYCYQRSTPAGKHGQRAYIESVAHTLEKAEVFEVAIGGGEPTLHPDFLSILHTFQRSNINVGFTTRMTNWLRDSKLRPEILDACKSFAISVSDWRNIAEISKLIDDDLRSRVTIHAVMGTQSEYDFEALLKACRDNHFPITLLGFKHNLTGKPSELKFFPKDYTKNDKWFKHVLEGLSKWQTINIDTKLAQDWEPFLQSACISNKLYHVEDGRFSCYIDAVEKSIAPSSYCDPSLIEDFANSEFGDLFSAFGKW